MTSKQKLHNAIIAAVLANLGDDLSPKDVLSYFQTSSEGLRMALSFCPSIDDFKANIQSEIIA